MIQKLSEVSAQYNIPIKGVIHIGSHHGLEYNDYRDNGVEYMMFFEPIASSYRGLVDFLPASDKIKTFNLALGPETCERKMYVETRNDGMSCSLLEPYKHLEMYPWITFDSFETVRVERLDNIDFDRGLYNIINIDVQGYELEVFRGAVETLKTIDIIYAEVNAVEMYKGCALVNELDNFLKDFVRVLDNIANNGRWGDALYIRKG